MFYIDFWGFTNDPLYFGYNSAGPENPVFHVFDVSGPKRSQKGLIFGEHHFLSTRTNLGTKKQQFWARRALRAWPTRPPPGRVEHPLGRLGRPIASILLPTDFP